MNGAEVVVLHDEILRITGIGSPGLRSVELLESALGRPFHGLADGTEFFPTALLKAAALLHALVTNHPFVDGNKRTAFACAGLFLESRGLILVADENETVELMVAVGDGRRGVDEIAEWLKLRLRTALPQPMP